MPALTLSFLSVVLAYAAFQKGGVWPADWYPCLLAIALIGLVHWAVARRYDLAPRPPRRLCAVLVLIPAVFALQLVPLPLAVARVLSPARAELEVAAGQAGGGTAWPTMSAVPSATVDDILTGLACLVTLLLVRELAWHFNHRPWIVALPLVVVGALEAAIGLLQAYAEGGDAIARGTYVNRNHFAGLLELCLPFALAWGLSLLILKRGRRGLAAGWALAGCILFAVGATLLGAGIHSGSRMGFIAVLFSLTLMGAVAWTARGRSRWKRIAVPLLLAVAAVAFVQLPTDALIAHFADWSKEEISSDTRAEIWRETLPVVAAFPVLGCGLGGYESVMTRYKAVAPLSAVDFAHNDYLQLLVEGGLAGFAAVLALAGLLVAAAVRGCARGFHSPPAFVALACLGALAAILLHSLVDFNLHIPVNALAAAWVGGLASAPE